MHGSAWQWGMRVIFGVILALKLLFWYCFLFYCFFLILWNLMEKLLLLATPSLWCVPEVSFESSLNNICLVALRFTMHYAVLLRDLFCKSRHCGSCPSALSRQVHSVGQCQGGGRLYGRGERLLIWRAAKTYQGLRRLSRVHVSFRVKAFQGI